MGRIICEKEEVFRAPTASISLFAESDEDGAGSKKGRMDGRTDGREGNVSDGQRLTHKRC